MRKHFDGSLLRLTARLALAGAHSFLPVALLGASATLVTACADENDPKTWAKQLQDPAGRVGAIKRFQTAFDDRMSKAGKNKEDPRVKEVLDAGVEPLAKTYTTATLDEKTRKDLIKLLSEMADPRGTPAFAKALNDFEPGKNEEDVRYAALATKRLSEQNKLTDQTLVDALWACFVKFRPSVSNKSINVVKDLRDSVVSVKHPSYGPKAIEKLAQPIIDPKDPTEGMDKVQFWYQVCIQILGALKYGPAAKPLVTVLLTPNKLDLAGAARLALMKIPDEAEVQLVAAAKGTDPDFAKLASEYPNKGHVPWLAEALAYISREKTRDAAIELLNAADSDANRTLISMNLVHFASDRNDKKVQDAFFGAYSKMGNEAVSPNGNAHSVFWSVSAQLYDPAVTDWLLKEGTTAKGDAAAVWPQTALPSAFKLMPLDKVKAVDEALSKAHLNKQEKERFGASFKAASDTVTKCDKNISCYLGKLDEPVPSSPPAAKMGHLKATYMIGCYGDDKARADLAAKLEKVTDDAMRLAMVEAIDHLAPKGDAQIADNLEKLSAQDAAANKNDSAGVFLKYALKLRSRATAK